MPNFTNLFQTTLIPNLPDIINSNFQGVYNYLNVFYNASTGVIVAPINTTGKITGATAQFTTGVFDNLTVRNQFTNLYSNVTNIDGDYIRTYNGIDVSTRVARPVNNENPSFSYVDLNTAYLKLNNYTQYAFSSPNIGQLFQVIWDVSGAGNFTFLINSSHYISVTAANSATTWIELICTNIDSSGGCTFIPKQFAGTFTINHT